MSGRPAPVRRLEELLAAGARRSPDALAVAAPDGERASYAELDAAANRAARALAGIGVGPGDRVALWLDKSVRTVAAMQGALRLGAAYVPVDPLHPPERAATLIRDCQPAAVVTSPAGAATLDRAGAATAHLTPDQIDATPADPVHWHAGGSDDLAYVLYTSGSTGAPKGVCLSHRNALAFVDWAASELWAVPADRFANHAPFHFDLSVLDLYVAFRAGASVHLVPQQLGYAPSQLVEFLAGQRITVWYSVPSALILMARHGGLLAAELPALRAVLFAGEPYPAEHLRRLRAHLPAARLLNLYGPTETNVCTFYEVPTGPDELIDPVPIGWPCSGDTVWVARRDGTAADPDEEGELVVTGPTVMLGYWGHQPQGDRPYRTGDRVIQRAGGELHYLGRRDGMVKVRGHRIELAEIESLLHSHPEISQAAVVMVGAGLDARLVAYLVPASGRVPDLLQLKRHCADSLPRYATVDEVHQLDDLPRTGNGKLDRRRLTSWAAATPAVTAATAPGATPATTPIG